MADTLNTEKIVPYALLGITAVTGLVDAVSFLSLGHVFTANMTGNVAFIAFAALGRADLSIARSAVALVAFLTGAVLGGRMMAGITPHSQLRVGSSGLGIETVLFVAAMLTAIGYRSIQPEHVIKLYALIILTALAMGVRNATMRKLAVPDLTTTVLTLSLTGLAADSSLARGTNPHWQRRVASIVAMFGGAALGAILVRHSVSIALAVCVAVSSACALTLFLLSGQVESLGHSGTSLTDKNGR